MTSAKTPRPGDWIRVGARDAVVCQASNSNNETEVVYIDDRGRAINEDIIFRDGEWTWRYQGPNGGYADKILRLEEFVRILRRGPVY